ncbi:MAG: TlpA family protein disulfide reductase [Bacteroidia bacterium]
MKLPLFYVLLLSLFSCKPSAESIVYRAELSINDSLGLPFFLSYNKTTEEYIIRNGSEKISGLYKTKIGDSIDLEHPVFNSSLRFVEGDTLKGYWYNREKGSYKMPLIAFESAIRFQQKANPNKLIAERWSTEFDEGEDKYPAVGVFELTEGIVTGTFLTETGDYRYLEGVLSDSVLSLSTFDMSHAFLFLAKVQDDQLQGMFYSGHHFLCSWNAIADQNAQLRSAQNLVGLVDTAEVNFEVVDFNGDIISLDHPSFKGKPLVVQIFGSWCPNCYDESIYLREIYLELQKDSIQLIGVGFEKSENEEAAFLKLQKFREGLDIPYPLAYGGRADKELAQTVFPFLDKVVAFPTLLFFNKRHDLIAIHTGFSGPGTGDHYLNTKKEIESLVLSLKEE